MFNRAKRKGFEHGENNPVLLCLNRLVAEDTNVDSPLFTVVLWGMMEVSQNFFSQYYLPHKCKLGKSDFVCKSQLIGGLNGTQPATFEFIDKSFSQNSQC